MAATTSSAVVQLHQREAFERNVGRALVAGAGAGLLTFATSRIGVPVPLALIGVAATALACVRGDTADKLMLAAASVFGTGLPWVFGLTSGWTVALSGAVAGAVMVKSRQCEKGEEGSIAGSRPGPAHYLGAVAGTAVLAVAGVEVSHILYGRLLQLQTPGVLAALASGAVLALFVSLGGLAAHLMLKADPIEARGEEVLAQLHGELHSLCERALGLYRQAGASLSALPRDTAREELARTLQRLTREAFELAGNWSSVEAQLQADTALTLEREVKELSASAAKASDLLARRQLELAAASLREELERLSQLKLERERVVAKLKWHLALLERARLALVGLRSGQVQLKAAELSALARKFSALATMQADEAKLAHEVATAAELAVHEATASENASTLSKAPLGASAIDPAQSPQQDDNEAPAAAHSPAPVASHS